ncbi:zinc finger protein 658B isoform X2 [Betta splendens]|uniref:Zinc finger protein 658B isoform X2 n=1 Tax=Betta splendens TaxID=158456 RepID=A0A6P7LNU9_BETSP|nr:zinc finger protein 658B isoform X2 [Betta splendens]
MSDLDTLIVTFQSQLSDVMQTVVKTAVYEVTRLVEDGFLEEVKRRNQEVESLRMQLQWAENKLSDHDGKERNNRCVDPPNEDLEVSTTDTTKERPSEHKDGILGGVSVKTEVNFVDKWTSCSQDASPQAAGDSTGDLAERTSESSQDGRVLPDVDVKDETVKTASCSAVQLGGWHAGFEEAGPELHCTSEKSEAQPKHSQENREELMKDVIKQDRQTSGTYVFLEDLEDKHLSTDQSHTSSLEVNRDWAGLTVATAGLLQNCRLATGNDCDSPKTRGHPKRTEHRVSNSVSVDVCAPVSPSRDHITSPESLKGKVQNSTALGVMIKQEVIVDSYGCGETRHMEKKIKKSGTSPFSCLVKQHNKVSLEEQKHNHVSHKASVQEFVKLHSKVGTGLRLQAALQHLHRPVKKPSHALSSSSMTALSAAHSHVVNMNRLSSMSKATPCSPLSAQRAHPGEKQSAAPRRASEPWVGIKTLHLSANAQDATPVPDPDAPPHAGPRHLLRCGQCGKCFPHPSNLKAHLQTHTGERPFCCSLCGRSFTKLSNLKAHRRVHTGERPYCCLACGKRFTQKCNLKRHQRIHLDV